MAARKACPCCCCCCLPPSAGGARGVAHEQAMHIALAGRWECCAHQACACSPSGCLHGRPGERLNAACPLQQVCRPLCMPYNLLAISEGGIRLAALTHHARTRASPLPPPRTRTLRAARLCLGVDVGCQLLPVPHKAIIGVVHDVDVGLHILPADWRVLCWVEGRRGVSLVGLLAKSPAHATALVGCPWIIDHRGKRLPRCVGAPVNVIPQAERLASPSGGVAGYGVRHCWLL